MMRTLSPLARKYAHAFLSVFGNKCTFEMSKDLDLLSKDIEMHREIILLAQLSCVPDARKNDMIMLFASRRNLDEFLKPLIMLVVKQGRVALFGEIVAAIRVLYEEQQGIVHCSIQSAHVLSEQMLTSIENDLARHLGKKIEYTASIDASLIAGIRIVSDSFLWERSIAQKLKTFNARKVG